MIRFNLADLPWLLPAPENYRALCRELENADAPSDAGLRRLSNYRLNVDQLNRFAKTVATVATRLGRVDALSRLRLGLLSDTTTDYVVPALVATAPRHGILLEVVCPAYGLVAQEVFGQSTLLQSSKLDAVLVSLDSRRLGLDRSEVDAGKARAFLESSIAELRTLVRGINERIGAPAILQTVPRPPEAWCGSYDRLVGGSARRLVEHYNEAIAELAECNGNILFDTEQVAALVGLDFWYNPSQWTAAKLPFSLDLVPFYADHAARILGAMRGKTRKCLVFDLDNTLWGGVVGDDGLEGIKLGQGSPDGEAYLSLQRYGLECRNRGIVLAVSSKNELDTGLLPFRNHREMLLKEDDIAVFRVNWDDKASNLRHIAKVLNIGTDALVFLDDNPAERERVRQMLPEVAVPELPDDPALYVRTVAAAGYFETLALSDEDRHRADFYQANAARSEVMEKMGDLEDYLQSLEMECILQPFDRQGRPRIAQLINKSNQYNLMTRRYTEAQVAEIEEDSSRYGLQIRLKDKFGDNGMISVVVFDKGQEAWECNTWLMSCRVLGRRVEEAALAELARAARETGAKRLIGHYIPSPKNKMVADHFARLGFKCLGAREGGGTSWELVLDEYHAPELPMRIIREVASLAA